MFTPPDEAKGENTPNVCGGDLEFGWDLLD